jgi:hypothetical protein
MVGPTIRNPLFTDAEGELLERVLRGWMRVFAYLYPFNSTYLAGTRIQTIWNPIT